MCYPYFINEETQVQRDEVTLPGFKSSKQAGLSTLHGLTQTPELMVSMIILYCIPFWNIEKEAKGNNTKEIYERTFYFKNF